jgi:hypothetical protein
LRGKADVCAPEPIDVRGYLLSARRCDVAEAARPPAARSLPLDARQFNVDKL